LASIRVLTAILIFSLPTFAQGVGGKAAIGGKAGFGGGAVVGTSVTVNLGGTWPAIVDSGNQDYLFTSPLLTPAAMTAASFPSCSVYFTAVDAAHPNWGCAIFSNLTTSGVVNTQNAASGGCVGNCVLLQSGSNFGTNWTSATILINGQPFYVDSVQSTSLLTVRSGVAIGTQTGVSYSVNTSNSLLCSAFSSTVATTGWNTLTLSGCPAPSPNTWYWVGSVTDSATQANWRTADTTMPCANVTNSMQFGTQLGSFTSNSSWPASVGAGAFSDGCIAAYASITYNTTNAYTIVTSTPGTCDAAGTTCVVTTPPTGTGHGMLVYEETSTTTTAAPTNGTDTFTVVGTCPTITGGGLNHHGCFYFTPRVTAGKTSVTCNFSALNKEFCWPIEILGTISSGSVDQNCYDTVITTSSPFTGCSTGTTGQAIELIVGAAVNELAFSPTWNVPIIVPTSPWVAIGSMGAAGNSPWPLALMYQISSSTGTFAVTASNSPHVAGTDGNFTAAVTLK
jgi:hypothetical protein